MRIWVAPASIAVVFVGGCILSYWLGVDTGRSGLGSYSPTPSSLVIAAGDSKLVRLVAPPVAPPSAISSPVAYEIQGKPLYRCADPTEICEHMTEIGCKVANCRDSTSRLGEDVCLELYEVKTPSRAADFGVKCGP